MLGVAVFECRRSELNDEVHVPNLAQKQRESKVAGGRAGVTGRRGVKIVTK
ncbi:hypothetical protein AGMMS49936_05220 [Endomicrobiia bacterium]|nr:hypothetical protein AGMMS49936_05220 [Endomicrobiia bacterium]